MGDVIDTIGCYLADRRRWKIIDVHHLGLPFGEPLLSSIFKVPHELLLLRIDRNDRLIGRLKGGGLVGNPLKLRIAGGVIGSPLHEFPVGLEAVPRPVQQFPTLWALIVRPCAWSSLGHEVH